MNRSACALSVVAVSLFSCGQAEDTGPTPDQITSIDDSAVKEQTIGNCWLYGTAAWAEQMHLAATGQVVDVSEAYWTFWYWYDQITDGPISRELRASAKDPAFAKGVMEGGYWGLAAELASAYGWMSEVDFKPGATSKAAFHGDAVTRLNATLRTGSLSTAESRKDRAAVLTELLAAWAPSSTTANKIVAVFGTGGERTFRSGAKASGVVRPLTELKSKSLDGATTISLGDVLGSPKAGSPLWRGQREGRWAWNDFFYDPAVVPWTKRRVLFRAIQQSLHAKLSVPLAWNVTNTVVNGEYSIVAADTIVRGGHLSVITDYEARLVPGFGTLAIGVPASLAAQDAAMSIGVFVTKVRVKNSWGSDPFWNTEEWRQFGRVSAPPASTKATYLPAKPGYNDIGAAYLWSETGTAKLRSVVLPLSQLRFPL